MPKVLVIIKCGPSADRLEPTLVALKNKGIKIVLISAFPESENSKYSDNSVYAHVKIHSVAQLVQLQSGFSNRPLFVIG